MTVLATQQSGDEAYGNAKNIARNVKSYCENAATSWSTEDQESTAVLSVAQRLRNDYETLANWISNPQFNVVATDKDGYAAGTAQTEYETMRSAMLTAYTEIDTLFPESAGGYLETHNPPGSAPTPRIVPFGALSGVIDELNAVVATIT